MSMSLGARLVSGSAGVVTAVVCALCCAVLSCVVPAWGEGGSESTEGNLGRPREGRDVSSEGWKGASWVPVDDDIGPERGDRTGTYLTAVLKGYLWYAGTQPIRSVHCMPSWLLWIQTSLQN